MINRESHLYKDIKEKIINTVSKNDMTTYNQDRNNYIDKLADFGYMIMTTDLKYMEIDKALKENYRVSITQDTNNIRSDFLKYNCKLVYESMNFDLESIKQRYETEKDYYEVEERMYYRINFYINNWDIDKIEKYISKHLMKNNIIFDASKSEYYYYLYNNLIKTLNLKVKPGVKKIGRPSLPKEIKEKNKVKHNYENKNLMKSKYDLYNTFKNIKDNMLTLEEYNLISEKIQHRTDIIDKLKKITLF